MGDILSWKEFLQETEERKPPEILPWLGELTLRSAEREWAFPWHKIPHQYGWYAFRTTSRHVKEFNPAPPNTAKLQNEVRGYLVGDHVVQDGARVDPDPLKVGECSEKVFLIEEGLDRFARICAGRIYPGGPLVYKNLEMPLGIEDAVLEAFLDQRTCVDHIKGVPPALDAAFRMETYRREQAEKRRLLLEQKRKEEEERRAREEKRQALVRQLGDGEGRREMARVDFDQAARAALRVGGADFLDAKPVRRGEWAVKYRVDGQRLECICNERLSVIDAGVCLTDHDTDEKGDTLLTLESIPSVIRQAIRERKLVIWRHV